MTLHLLRNKFNRIIHFLEVRPSTGSGQALTV